MTARTRNLRTETERALDDVALAARKLDRATKAAEDAQKAYDAAKSAREHAARVLAHARRHPAIPEAPRDEETGLRRDEELDGRVYPGGISLAYPTSLDELAARETARATGHQSATPRLEVVPAGPTCACGDVLEADLGLDPPVLAYEGVLHGPRACSPIAPDPDAELSAAEALATARPPRSSLEPVGRPSDDGDPDDGPAVLS